ncbi:L,D-transpeptidase [Streptacidiphilus sp. P02-A3a]|nr:L,D-transpeptidase [Streptacidiphilus sp. P02-A3a]
MRPAAVLLAALALLGTGCAQASAAPAPAAPASARAAAPAAAGARAAVRPPRADTRALPGSAAAARAPGGRHRARHQAARRPVARPAGPDAAGRCPATLGRIACVDLSRQLMWVQVGTRVVFGPVRVRTGRAGYVTRTGLWHVYRRNRDQWSTLYDVAMPYSQFFSGGEAFHGLDGESMYTPPGSHGCVNMNTWDARTLWGILRSGDPVEVFGRKPGT